MEPIIYLRTRVGFLDTFLALDIKISHCMQNEANSS